jgi:hypothetical protein
LVRPTFKPIFASGADVEGKATERHFGLENVGDDEALLNLLRRCKTAQLQKYKNDDFRHFKVGMDWSKFDVQEILDIAKAAMGPNFPGSLDEILLGEISAIKPETYGDTFLQYLVVLALISMEGLGNGSSLWPHIKLVARVKGTHKEKLEKLRKAFPL